MTSIAMLYQQELDAIEYKREEAMAQLDKAKSEADTDTQETMKIIKEMLEEKKLRLAAEDAKCKADQLRLAVEDAKCKADQLRINAEDAKCKADQLRLAAELRSTDLELQMIEMELQFFEEKAAMQAQLEFYKSLCSENGSGSINILR
jgi:hypothetical protein